MARNQISELAGSSAKADGDALHTVRITSSARKKNPVKAYLPENVSLTVASDWSAPFADKAEGALNTVANLFGASLKTKASTAQIWQGSTPIEVTIPFILTAESDPATEIIEPIQELMKLCLPSTTKGQRFIPPGPSFKGYVAGQLKGESAVGSAIAKLASSAPSIGSNGESITVEVGNFMIFTQVVLLSVNPTFHTQRLHHSGLPLRADVEITFRKYTTSVKGEVDNILALANARSIIAEANKAREEGLDQNGAFNNVRKRINKLTSKF